MKIIKVTSTKLKNLLGLYFDEVESKDIIITKNKREKAVMISYERYKQLCHFEEEYYNYRVESFQRGELIAP